MTITHVLVVAVLVPVLVAYAIVLTAAFHGRLDPWWHRVTERWRSRRDGVDEVAGYDSDADEFLVRHARRLDGPRCTNCDGPLDYDDEGIPIYECHACAMMWPATYFEGDQ